MPQIRQPPMRIRLKSVPLHRAERPRHALAHVLAAVERHQPPAPRNQVHQPLERRLHRRQVRVDVRVVELHMGQDRRVGKVVQELRPLVEERRVVLVAFEDEGLAYSLHHRPHHEAGAKVLRHAANQERRRKLRPRARGNFIYPRQHAGRGRLAMRPGHHQRLAPRQKLVVQHRSHRGKRNARVQHKLQLDVAARDGIAHDHEVRPRRKVALRIRLHQRNPQPSQQVAHRRIRRRVRARHPVPARLQHPRQRRHRRPANPNQMDMFRQTELPAPLLPLTTGH